MPIGQIGVAFSASQLSSVLAILAAPLLFKKLGLVTSIFYTQIAAAAALGILSRTSSMTAATALYASYSALLWMSEPGMFTLLMNRVDPWERSGASALNLLVMSLSGAVAAALAGVLLARYGYPPVMYMTAVLTLSAACIFRLLLHHDALPGSLPVPARLSS